MSNLCRRGRSRRHRRLRRPYTEVAPHASPPRRPGRRQRAMAAHVRVSDAEIRPRLGLGWTLEVTHAHCVNASSFSGAYWVFFFETWLSLSNAVSLHRRPICPTSQDRVVFYCVLDIRVVQCTDFTQYHPLVLSTVENNIFLPTLMWIYQILLKPVNLYLSIQGNIHLNSGASAPVLKTIFPHVKII